RESGPSSNRAIPPGTLRAAGSSSAPACAPARQAATSTSMRRTMPRNRGWRPTNAMRDLRGTLRPRRAPRTAIDLTIRPVRPTVRRAKARVPCDFCQNRPFGWKRRSGPRSMSTPIRIGIAGYGNLGKGVETALARNPDMTLVGVFSRREPASIALRDPAVAVHPLDRAADFADAIDVMILCGGSKTDLPEQGPALAAAFNTVDSFDTHARIPEYFDAVDAAAQRGGHVALISVGWDPGLFSMERLLGEAILPQGDTYTFWGKGLS